MKHEVLVIDDNFDIRNLISEILKDKNYNVQIVKEPSLENTALYNLYAQR